MKISISAEAKRIITIAEMPVVYKVIEAMKEDTCTAKDYAELAARIVSDRNAVKVLEANAEIVKNCRVHDRFCEGSGQFDVWVAFTAVIDDGFEGIIMGGAYLTDIWDYTADNADEIREHMFIRKFFEVEQFTKCRAGA